MKPLILALAVFATCLYLKNSQVAAQPEKSTPAPAARPVVSHVVAPSDIVVAPSASYDERWKFGPTAQNDWKLGPNAQTDFKPFAPLEQADWNHASGYTIVSGVTLPPTVIRR